ncbi:MAG: peroxiredoxin [Cyclobacteriaceae bacterium]
MSTIKVGDILPSFSLPDENNQLIDVKNELVDHHLVIFFYPKDNTIGCTVEASEFRDNYHKFKERKTKIYGISSDSPESHAAFKKKCGIPYSLLSDKDQKVRGLFGIKPSLLGMLPGRVTYVIRKTGEISHIFDSQWRPEKHIGEAMTALSTIQLPMLWQTI